MFWAKDTGPEGGTPHADPGCASEQYRDGPNLGARTASHAGTRATKDTGAFAAPR